MNLTEKFALMASGQPYNDLDPQLTSLRDEATSKTEALNHEADPVKKAALFASLAGAAGPNAFVNPTFRCEFGQNIFVGADFYANYDCVILDGAPVHIGDNVLFGPKVGLYTSNHLFDAAERKSGGCIAKPITIGDRVWLAANVSVTPGVTIGSDTIVGAGSVVTHDLPANVLAAGNPCRVLRPITAADKTGFVPSDLN